MFINIHNENTKPLILALNYMGHNGKLTINIFDTIDGHTQMQRAAGNWYFILNMLQNISLQHPWKQKENAHLLYDLNTSITFEKRVSEMHWTFTESNNNWLHNQWRILLNEQTDPFTGRTCSWSVSSHPPSPVMCPAQRE